MHGVELDFNDVRVDVGGVPGPRLVAAVAVLVAEFEDFGEAGETVAVVFAGTADLVFSRALRLLRRRWRGRSELQGLSSST